MPNLSRRHLVTTAAALPALALPAAVLPVAAVAKPITAPAATENTPNASTKIAKLCERLKTAKKNYAAQRRVYEMLERQVMQKAGKPDPLIQYNEANDALGLEWLGASPPRSESMYDSYLRPIDIERRLPGPMTIGEVKALRGRPFHLTKKQIALRDQLQKRLKVSRSYHQKVIRLSRDMGLDAAGKKLDALSNREADIEIRILKTLPESRTDLAIKIAFCEKDGDLGYVGPYVLRDIKRIFPEVWGAVQS